MNAKKITKSLEKINIFFNELLLVFLNYVKQYVVLTTNGNIFIESFFYTCIFK